MASGSTAKTATSSEVAREGRRLRPRTTHDQTAENQLLELRRYVAARGWTAVEYVDHGVAVRRIGGPRSTSSSPTCVGTGARCRLLAARSTRTQPAPPGAAARRVAVARGSRSSRSARASTPARRPGDWSPASWLDRRVRARAHSGTHPRGPGACESTRQAPRAAPIACDAGAGRPAWGSPCGRRSALGSVRRHDQAVASQCAGRVGSESLPIGA